MDDKPAAKVRGLFANVVNAESIEDSVWQDKTKKFGASSKEAGLVLDSKDLGFCIVTLEPGRRSCPYHFHHSESEVFYVMSGSGTLRQGKTDKKTKEESTEELELNVGDFISFPAGTGIAHQFINNSDKDFVYLAMSNRIKSDVAEYPDSDKILVRGSGTMLRRTPNLSYLDGEV